jgi:FkbM family methyltransferase
MKRDIPFKFDQSSDLGRWRAETFWEKEPETIAWIESFNLKQLTNLDFIDIGANLGIYSLFALTTGFFRRVIAVEPMPINFSQLKTNISLNHFEERSVLYSQPLYSRALLANFKFEDKRVGASGGQVIAVPSDVPDDKKTLVQCLTGDDIIESNYVDSCVIKLDVDGLELEILKGFEKALAQEVVLSVLVEATTQNMNDIVKFMSTYSLILDSRFDSIENHSTKRRIVSGNTERNLIFSKKSNVLF